MFTAIRLIPILVATATLGACMSTPYQPEGFRGGYKDMHIRDNIYYVQFSGNAWIDTMTAVQYFHRRAKEVCLENGYKDYRVSQERDITGHMAVVNSTNATILQKPGSAGYVECLS
jgi:hypothetical protein